MHTPGRSTRSRRRRPRRGAWVLLLVFATVLQDLAAAGHSGVVTLAGRGVPGATVTASQGAQRIVTTTSTQGTYRFADLADGAWTIRVEMAGFSPASREITIPVETEPLRFDLTLLPIAEIEGAAPIAPLSPTAGVDAAPTTGTVVQGPARAPASASPGSATSNARETSSASSPAAAPRPEGTAAAAGAPAAEPAPPPDAATGAADGFVITGSVNNAASSPFAQSAAFGNFRPARGRSRYFSTVTLLGGSSALNATPYSSLPNRPTPDYTTLNFTGTVSGPIHIPGLIRNGPNFQLNYQRTASDDASSLLGRMPTLRERGGDFSALPMSIIDPQTGLPFADNTIPADRISPQAAALLHYFPLPNDEGAEGINYQIPRVSSTRSHGVTFGTARALGRGNQVNGTVSYNRGTTRSSSLFGFEDSTESSNVGANGAWTRRINPFLSLRVTHTFSRVKSSTVPHFANLTNVSGEAGIQGNNQDAVNWGPPTLTFSGSVSALTDANFSSSRTLTNTSASEVLWTRGRHNVTVGGQVGVTDLDLVSQDNPRGTFLFAGDVTGSAFADFLLGLPRTSSLAFGNADKQFHGWSSAAYIADDWRVRPYLTLNIGLRWEYESPVSESLARLVNLDVAPGFTAVSPVLASDGTGALTGRRYPSALVRSDWRGLQPRVAIAWRPILGSSLLVRAGYDRTRTTGAFQTLARLMAQQPPLSTTGNAIRTPETPLSLADGFVVSPDITQNTFAVDPDFRVAYAQNWQVYAQRDMPFWLTMGVSYLGTHGSRLVQQFLPNTFPIGGVNPCPTCPAGFRYVTSNGTSDRHGIRLEVRRRSRNGLTASAQYTLANATDNTTGFGSVGGASTAQDWLDLDAERGPSSFDQRHLFGAQVSYNTGVGIRGGAFLTGIKGKLIRNWTLETRFTTGSGLPLTPLYQPQTTLTPPVRADLTDVSDGVIPDGYYLNPAAYTIPAAGSWGRAGRNSVRGPRTFSLDGSIQRAFPMGGRVNLDLRVDITNLLNRVIYTGVDTLIGSPQFGLPTGVGSMRRVNTRVSLRF